MPAARISMRKWKDLMRLKFEAKLDLPEVPFDLGGKREEIEAVIREAKEDGRDLLTLIESRRILESLGVPLTTGRLLRTRLLCWVERP